jgi:hypothetical protein
MKEGQFLKMNADVAMLAISSCTHLFFGPSDVAAAFVDTAVVPAHWPSAACHSRSLYRF